MAFWDIFNEICRESWHVMVDASPYILLGFFVAGLLKAFVPDGLMAKHLGSRSLGSVVKAALAGVPLPLCSCGVLPAALGLRKQGASKGAATAFMISTPETGVDSMAVTYALIDPIMTVVRPVAAFITAVFAGGLVNAFADEREKTKQVLPMAGEQCSCSGCDSDHTHSQQETLWQRFCGGMSFAFVEMIADIGKWLLLGVFVAGLISTLIPDGFIEQHVGSGIFSLILMLFVGLPLYVCATSSTPIAASLLLKGLSPGAALVFLLAGPATNGATLTVVFKVLGRKAASLYIVAIASSSLLLGWLVDRLYVSLGLDIRAVVAGAGEVLPHWVGVGSALLTLALILWTWIGPRSSSCGCKG